MSKNKPQLFVYNIIQKFLTNVKKVWCNVYNTLFMFHRHFHTKQDKMPAPQN